MNDEVSWAEGRFYFRMGNQATLVVFGITCLPIILIPLGEWTKDLKGEMNKAKKVGAI